MDKPLIPIIIAVLLLVGLAIAIIQKKKFNRLTDFRVFFIIGIIWIPLGISTENYIFSIIGIVFTLVGILHKDKWQKNVPWSQMEPRDKKIKLAIIISVSLLLITGIVLFLLKKSAAG